MSDVEKQQTLQEDQYEYASESEPEQEQEQQQQVAQPPKQGTRTMQRARQNQVTPQQVQQQQVLPQENQVPNNMTGRQYDQGRTWPIRESRIKDRPQPKEVRDSSLKIKIELDLEVEVDLYARVKGDVTIGLM